MLKLLPHQITLLNRVIGHHPRALEITRKETWDVRALERMGLCTVICGSDGKQSVVASVLALEPRKPYTPPPEN